ncbi:DUF6979 family protein [Brevibacillus sp. NPDC003359]|uniref:DUF6979 family protein n=1 Tax=Brevibacillus sp. NPDC003359 TaxID=3363950 RepID=UPI0036C98838
MCQVFLFWASFFVVNCAHLSDFPRWLTLELCEEGFVRGIEPGNYTKSLDNKTYALQAAELLVTDPSPLTKSINLMQGNQYTKES